MGRDFWCDTNERQSNLLISLSINAKLYLQDITSMKSK